jgi:hypothetical protein
MIEHEHNKRMAARNMWVMHENVGYARKNMDIADREKQGMGRQSERARQRGGMKQRKK